MKTSNQCLSALIAVLFLGSASLMVVERILMGHEPAVVTANPVDTKSDKSGDSSGVIVPGDGVKWNRVNLGIRRSFKRGIIEDSSIFRDIRLTYIDSWCVPGSFLKPFGGHEMFWFGLRYRKSDADSTKSKDSGGYENDNIYIRIIKYKEKRLSHEVDAYKKTYLKPWSLHLDCGIIGIFTHHTANGRRIDGAPKLQFSSRHAATTAPRRWNFGIRSATGCLRIIKN